MDRNVNLPVELRHIEYMKNDENELFELKVRELSLTLAISKA